VADATSWHDGMTRVCHGPTSNAQGKRLSAVFAEFNPSHRSDHTSSPTS